MKHSITGLIIILMLQHLSCTVTPPADIIYTNASIWTGTSDGTQSEAIAVSNEEIVGVGSSKEVMKYKGSDTRVVDLAGKLVLPGFIDAHTHFIDAGIALNYVDLRGSESPVEFAQRIGDFAKTLTPGRWIIEGGWDHERWGGELPHKAWIDSLTPDNPVFVSRTDGHMGLANSLALELAKITSETPNPGDGVIVIDPESGQPTGILKDNAMGLIWSVVPEWTEAELDEANQRAIEHSLKRGVTQIHNMGTWSHLETFKRFHDQGQLKLRVHSYVPLYSWSRLAEYVDKNGRGDDWLRWGGLKGFVDGSLGSTTAWFYEPYSDEPATSGLVVNDLDKLNQQIISADAAGLQVAIHAIGDQANDWLLNSYEQAAQTNGKRDRRFRIEHAQHLTPEAIPRFASQGVIPSMQAYHAIDDGRWAEKRIGPERIKTTYPFRSLLDKKSPLAFGSDWSVAPIDPLLGIYAAVTRRTLDDANPQGWVPEEKITVEEAVRAYTSANAYAGFQEDRIGTLEAGKLADFIVLSEDIFSIDPNTIDQVKVLRTVVGGVEQYVLE